MATKNAADPIDYQKPFLDAVQGQLKARFRLDREGEPLYDPYPGDRRLRVYSIDLSLESPRAENIGGVRYYMDDSSYEDPEGYSADRDNAFPQEITSYGDVQILVTVEMDGHRYQQRAWLSHMLENGHAERMTPAIQEALQRIKFN